MKNSDSAVSFFISRTGADKAVAQRVGQVLEQANYSVLLQDWDFGGANFVAKMDDALQRSERVIVILSNRYLQSAYCSIEWQAVFANDPRNFSERLVLLKIDPACRPAGILKTIAYADLTRVEPTSALFAEIVLARVDRNRRGPAADLPFMLRAECILGEEFAPQADFVGRSEPMAALRTALASPRPQISTRVVAVVGAPGIGKTVLSYQFGYEQRELYAGVWRIGAASEANIVDGLVKLGGTLLPELANAQDRSAAARLSLALASGNTDRPWLLIFDDLFSEELYRRWAPAVGVDVVLTSRNPGFGKRIFRVQLTGLGLEQSANLLVEGSGRSDIAVADVSALANHLDGLPLALSHAAAYLRDNTAETPSNYLRNLTKRMGEAPIEGNYPRSVIATFQSALAAARNSEPFVDAIASLGAIFAAERIPEDLFISAEFEVAETARGDLDSGEASRRAISALSRLSLSTFDQIERTVTFPRLIQALVSAQLGNDVARWLGIAIRVLNTALPNPEFQNWHIWERLIPHALSLMRQNALQSFPPDFLSKVAMYAYDRGDFDTAESIYRYQVEITNAIQPVERATALSNLGSVLVATDQPTEARAMLEQAVVIEKRELGNRHPTVALTLTNLACVMHNLGETTGAISMLKQAVELLEGESGDVNELATALADLAGMLRDTNQMEDAEILFRRALALNENQLGPNHPAVGTDLQNLADLLADTSRTEEARNLQGRAIEILAKTLPPQHPKLVWAFSRARVLKGAFL